MDHAIDHVRYDVERCLKDLVDQLSLEASSLSLVVLIITGGVGRHRCIAIASPLTPRACIPAQWSSRSCQVSRAVMFSSTSQTHCYLSLGWALDSIFVSRLMLRVEAAKSHFSPLSDRAVVELHELRSLS